MLLTLLVFKTIMQLHVEYNASLFLYLVFIKQIIIGIKKNEPHNLRLPTWNAYSKFDSL